MKPGSHRSTVRFGLSLYRLLFRLFPLHFRREYEPWARQAFRDQSCDALERSGFGGLMLVWLASVPDVLGSAIRERLEGNPMNRRDVLHSSPRSKPLFWIMGFTLVSLGAFPLGWLVVLTLERLLAGPAFDLASRRLLLNANTSMLIMALVLGICQSFLVRRAGLPAKGWLAATSFGLFAGTLLADEAWSGNHYWAALFFWQRLRFLMGVAHALVVGAITGLIVGFTQWLVLRRRVRRSVLWIPLSVAALVVQLIAQDGVIEGGLLRLVPLIVPAAMSAAGLAILLRDSAGSEKAPAPPPLPALGADPT